MTKPNGKDNNPQHSRNLSVKLAAKTKPPSKNSYFTPSVKEKQPNAHLRQRSNTDLRNKSLSKVAFFT